MLPQTGGKRLIKKEPQVKRLIRKDAPGVATKSVTIPSVGLVKGLAEPNRPGVLLVEPKHAPKHPMFKGLNPARTLPDTFYRYEPATRRVKCLVTKMTDSCIVAWDMCGLCTHYFTLCTCSKGLSVPRSVEYIYDSIVAKQNGEEWDLNHPNYKGSLSKAEREKAQDGPRHYVMPDRGILNDLPGNRPSTKPQRPQATAPVVQGRVLRKERDLEVVKAASTGDMTKATEVAEEVGGDLLKRLLKKVDEPPQKKPVKKIIRKG